jgi:hypothetical protein
MGVMGHDDDLYLAWSLCLATSSKMLVACHAFGDVMNRGQTIIELI